MINDNLDYSNLSFAVLKCCACAVKRIVAMIVRLTNLNLVAQDSTKER